MTVDEQIKILESNSEFERKDGDLQGCLNFRQLANWLKDYKKLLEQKPCGDCISRREAIKMFTYNSKGEHIPDYDCDNFPVQIAMKTVKEMLRDLPSVTPQPKMGKWEWKPHPVLPYTGNWYCSECNLIGQSVYDYCPSCGAYMQEAEE